MYNVSSLSSVQICSRGDAYLDTCTLYPRRAEGLWSRVYGGIIYQQDHLESGFQEFVSWQVISRKSCVFLSLKFESFFLSKENKLRIWLYCPFERVKYNSWGLFQDVSDLNSSQIKGRHIWFKHFNWIRIKEVVGINL